MTLTVGVITLLFVIGFPIFTYYFMRTKVYQQGFNPAFIARFSSLFFTLNLCVRYALLQPTLFLFRRLLLIISLSLLRTSPTLQILFFELSTLPFLYLLVVKPPLLTPFMNRIEIYNELVVLACSLILFSFTDYGPAGSAVGQAVKDSAGWVYIGLACSVIGVTIIAIGYETGKALIAMYRAKREAMEKEEKQKKYALESEKVEELKGDEE